MLKALKAKRVVEKPHVKKDDTVVVLSGDDAGKKGRVLAVEKSRGMATVEGINFIKRHQRPSKKIGKGGIIQKEGPINLSNLGLLCPSCNKLTHPTVIRHQDEKSRVCALCKEPIGRK